MNETEIFNFIFRGTTEFGDVQQELAKLLAIGQELRNESLRYQAEKRKERDEAKKAADEARQAAVTEINARLGITKSLTDEIGIIQKLQNEQRILRQLRAESNNVADINKYTAALQASQKELNTLTGATDKFKGSNGFWREMQGWVTAALATSQLTQWGSTLVKNEAYLESQRLALRNVITSQTEYANSLAFLDRISNKYGQDITILTESYKSFIAASEESGLSLKERNRIYESIIKSGSALNLTNDQIKGSLNAVAQMFSKGNVQAEELRGQLGERLPGAFGLAAKALGVTEAKLNDMLKQGQVLAKDLLPLLATQLEKTYGDKASNNVNTLAGSQNRFTNSIKEYFGEVNKNLGITDKLAKGFNFLADNLGLIVNLLKAVTTGVVGYTIATNANIIATKAGAIASGAWAAIEQAFLIIRGEAILLTRSQAVANATLTASELAATEAALAFNAAIKANPFVAIASLITTAIVAYQLYETTVQKSREEQDKLNKSIGEAIAPMRLEQEAFNSLAKSVLNNNLSVEERTRALDELKKRYPDNLKGISDLKEAEQKLSTVIRNTNADFLIRSKLLENEVRESINRERATVFITKQIELEQKLANTRKAIASDISSGTLKVLKASEANLIQQLDSTKAIVAKFAKANSNIEEQNNNITKNLKYNYDEQVKTVTAGEGKKNKEKIDSAKTLALLEEKSNNDSLERTRRTEQESLRLQREIDIQRIKDSTLSADAKGKKILAIEAKWRSDSSQLTNKWDKKEEEDEIKNGTLVAKIRADFRALNEKDEKKSLESQIKAIEAKYKNEIDIVSKSSKTYNEKKTEITKLVIEEEKELLVIRRQIEFLKDLDKLHKEQSKNIQKLTKDILEKWKQQDKIDKEEVEHQKELAKLYQERQEIFSKAAANLMPEAREFINYNQAVNNAGRAIINFADEKLKLANIEERLGRLSDEYIKQLEITNKAQEASVKASTEVTESRIALIKSATELVLGSIIKLIADSYRQLANAVSNANKIYQDFAKQQRQAEIAAFKQDLDYRLSELDGNYDKQIELLKDYLVKANEVIDRINIADSIAEDFQIASDKITRISESLTRRAESFSLNPVNILKNTVNTINEVIGSFYENNLELQQRSAIGISNTIQNLQWQRDEAISVLDNLADIYRDKYNDMLDTVKDSLSDQVDAIKEGAENSKNAIREGLNKQLDALNEWYNGQRDWISDKYQGLIDNKKRIDDNYFDNYITKQTNARAASESLAEGEKDAQIAALKTQYTEGKITLAEYITAVQNIEGEFYTKRIEDRGIFYEQLRGAATSATNKEIEDLKIALAEGKITQDKYDTDLGVIQARGAQRQSDINGLIKADRDKDLTDLKTNYLDIKVMAEDKAAKDIEKIRSDSAKAITKLEEDAGQEIIRITTLRNAQLEALARQRRDTELAYNAQIFEQQRNLARAQALIAFEQAKAQAYSNPFTAAETMKGIVIEFQKILEAIDGASNPFQRQIEDNSIQNNKDTPVNDTGDPNIGSFKDGTERLPNKSGKNGVDTELINADVGERIIPTRLNNMLKGAFGKDIKNTDLVNLAMANYTAIDYARLASVGMSVSSTDPKLTKAIEGLSNKLGNIKQLNVSLSKSGVSLEERTGNRIIRRRQ